MTRALARSGGSDGSDAEVGDVTEHGVVGDEVDAEPDGGGRDPAVRFVDLVTEAVSGTLAGGP